MSVIINWVHLRLVRQCPHFNDFTFWASSLSILLCNNLICDFNLSFSKTSCLLFSNNLAFFSCPFFNSSLVFLYLCSSNSLPDIGFLMFGFLLLCFYFFLLIFLLHLSFCFALFYFFFLVI